MFSDCDFIRFFKNTVISRSTYFSRSVTHPRMIWAYAGRTGRFVVMLRLFSILEPPHDKLTKWHVRSAKTQISLDIHPVWSESSLSAWRKLRSLAIQSAHSGDADLSLSWAHMPFCWFCQEAAHCWIAPVKRGLEKISCSKMCVYKFICFSD